MSTKSFVLKMAKGYQGRGKNCVRIARERVEKGLQYQYISRKLKKRDMRRLWIQQIGAAAKQNGTSYSKLQFGLVVEDIILDRKILATLAQFEPYSFSAISQIAAAAFEREHKHSSRVLPSEDHSDSSDDLADSPSIFEDS